MEEDTLYTITVQATVNGNAASADSAVSIRTHTAGKWYIISERISIAQ